MPVSLYTLSNDVIIVFGNIENNFNQQPVYLNFHTPARIPRYIYNFADSIYAGYYRRFRTNTRAHSAAKRYRLYHTQLTQTPRIDTISYYFIPHQLA